MTLRLRIAAHSEIGLVRKNNQDSGYASANLLVVADGMGGAAAGDLASAVAVDTIRRVDAPATGEEMLEVLAGALHKANDRIADMVDVDYALEGMGTTVTGALFDGTQLGLAHIGDSRAYLLHDSRLERLTHDHSWVQSLVDNGKISEKEAGVHPHRSLLLKVLNGQPANDPDLTLVRVEAGDRLLICSDGLCGLVDDPAIEAAMRIPDLEAALRQLVEEARAEGGVDNITAILADVVESGSVELGAAEHPVVLGAAAERTIPPVETRLRRQSGAAPDSSHPDKDDAGTITDLGAAARASPVADDEARYSPQPPRHRSLRRGLVAVVALVLVVGVGLGSAYAWTRTQFYVGAAGERVAIFQGLNERLPGLSLSRLYEVQPLAVSALPPYYQERVRASIDVSGLGAARRTVTELTDAARRCAAAAARPTSAPSGSVPSATPGGVPSKPGPATSTSTISVAPTPVRSASTRPVSASPSPASAAPRTPPSSPTSATPAPDC